MTKRQKSYTGSFIVMNDQMILWILLLFTVLVISLSAAKDLKRTATVMLAIDQWIMDHSGYFVITLGLAFTWALS